MGEEDVDWVGRVTSLNQWRRGGVRAPHKPLLLLYALGDFHRHDAARPLPFTAVEATVDALLREFGPPRATTSAYPFFYLKNDDGLWHLDGEGTLSASPGALRKGNAVGALSPGLATDLAARPRLLPQLARAILDANFEPSLHEDILAAVGLELEPVEAAAPRRRRDPEFRTKVLRAYERRCAFCGYDGALGAVSVGLDAAHLRWWAADGPDSVENGVCLCALHHKLLDKGVLGVTEDHRVAVSADFVGRGEAARRSVLELAGREVIPPQGRYPRLEARHIRWHASEVFRDPARAA